MKEPVELPVSSKSPSDVENIKEGIQIEAKGKEDAAEECGDIEVKKSEIDILKQWSGQILYTIGYTGPPGSKNVKEIKQESRVISSSIEMKKLCDRVVNYYFEGVRGPAGRRKFTPEICEWMQSTDDLTWEEFIVVVVVDKRRRPQILSVRQANDGVLEIRYCTAKHSGQMETRHGFFSACLLPRTFSMKSTCFRQIENEG